MTRGSRSWGRWGFASGGLISAVGLWSGCTVFDGFTRPVDAGAEMDAGAPDDARQDLDGGSPYVALILASHPLAYYRLGEEGGSVAKDSSGHHLDCTYSNVVQYAVPGVAGDHAVQLGETSGVYCSPDASTAAAGFSGHDPFTIEGWFWPTEVGGITVLYSYELVPVSGRVGYQEILGTPSAPNVQLKVFENGNAAGNCGAYADLAAIGCIEDGGGCPGFIHIALVYDGTNLSTYLNGSSDNAGQTGDCHASMLSPLQPGEALTIGNAPGVTDYGFVGAMSEVAFYGTALDASTIEAHYKAGKP